MKKLLVLALISILLCGCSSQNANQPAMVCTGESAEGLKQSNTVYADGDVVTRMLYESELDFSQYELDAETVQTLVNAMSEAYNALEFVHYDFELTDSVLKENVDIDLSEVNEEVMDGLAEIGIIESSEDAKYISLEMTRSNFEQSGLTCK